MLRKTILEETCSKIISFCNKKSLKDGICIHSPAIKLGIDDNLLLTNNLLSLYAKSYGIEHARHLFDEMPHRDVVSWTTLLSAYAKDGRHVETLSVFNSMKSYGIIPNQFTFSNVLRSCSALGDLCNGVCVHACVIKHGFDSNPILCCSLIELYSNWDLLQEAIGVFNGMRDGDTVSWTAMVSSFVEARDSVQALRLFIRMIEERVVPNEYTFVKVLSACSFVGIHYGRLVHAQLVFWGVRLNLVLKTALVDMYAKCKRMDEALKVLKQADEDDVQLWTTVIAGFAQSLNFEKGVSAFKQMVGKKIVPNNYCYAAILSVCASGRDLKLGRQIHAQLIVAALENDVSIGNALLDFYTKCSVRVEDVTQVFKRIFLPNVISWSTLIAGLAAHGFKEACFRAFLEMQLLGHHPNSFTLSSILRVCGTNETRKIHGFIIKTNGGNNTVIGNALVNAYAGSNADDCAIKLAKRISNRNVVTYTILASRLNETGHHWQSLRIVNHVRKDGFLTDGFILSSFLSASANLGDVRTGKQLHCFSIISGFCKWRSVSNSLVDLYGKCRHIKDAQKAFSEISEPDVISWNGLMHSYVLNGQTSSALSTLEDMRLAGIEPDSITLSIVVFACNQDSLADIGLEYFQSLREVYKIEAGINHYNAVVDLLGRAGRIDEALSLVKLMPISPNVLTYKKLLHTCKLHGNMLLGEEIGRRGLELDPCDVEFYALLASIYDNAGRFDLGDNMRSRIDEVCKNTSLAHNLPLHLVSSRNHF